MWTGADCSQRTCPLGVAFDTIATQDHRVGRIDLTPAAGSSQRALVVDISSSFSLSSDVRYFVRVTHGGDEFQWKREQDTFYSLPVDIRTDRDSAFELVHNGVSATGVRVYFDAVLTVNEGDVYTFVVSPNNGVNYMVMDANTVHQEVQCSGRGLCDAGTGRCQCFDGYSGEACQRTTCPNGCSGHGVCQELRRFASDASDELNDADIQYDEAYDARKEMGCACDAGFRGPDCSLIECPSGADPLGGEGADEGRDCSGRGVCDYSSGVCQCFKGYFGERCESQSNYV